MIKHDCTEARPLPNVDMYGGDTTPWEISLVNDDGTSFSIGQGADCTATLTLTPLKATTGLGNNANTLPPMLTKEGVLEATGTGGAAVIFKFAEADTKSLRGKFLYQIEIRHGSDLRVGQGNLYIKQNINR